MSTRYELRKSDRAKRWRALRRWGYGVAVAFVPLAAAWGWLSPEALPLIVPLLVALFNVKAPDSGAEG